jgi:DNA-binding response OmpR family regulator
MSMNILVVDDDEVLRRELSKWLSREGNDVTSAGSGATAVEMVKNQDFNLIFTDLKMPGMSGMDVLKAVKKLRPNVHMVIITAYGTIDTAVEAMKIGADDFICKPFEMEQLQSVIRNVGKTIEFEKQIKRINLVEEQKSKDPFEFFKSVVRDGKGLCITQQNPKNIRKRYDLQNISMLWLTPDQTGGSCIHPKKIYELKLTINSFFMDNPGGAVFFDGIEALIKESSWEIVRKFIQEVSNTALNNKSRFVISTKPHVIEGSELAELKHLISKPYIQLMSESFSSPIRRDIVRFLSHHGSSSFTRILKEVKLKDAPKLSFHLKRMTNDRILQKTEKKGYTLTIRGKSAAEFLTTMEKEAISSVQNNVFLISGSNAK